MNDVLPIGSIIYLKEGQQKVMILSRGCQLQQDNEVVFFGYSGAAYPVGLNPEQIFYFNQEDIDKRHEIFIYILLNIYEYATIDV